jgi:hypothetical protein
MACSVGCLTFAPSHHRAAPLITSYLGGGKQASAECRSLSNALQPCPRSWKQEKWPQVRRQALQCCQAMQALTALAATAATAAPLRSVSQGSSLARSPVWITCGSLASRMWW